MEPIEYKVGLGDIYTVTQDAIKFAKQNQKRNCESQEGYFLFNGLKITFYSSSEPRDIVEKYYLLHQLRKVKPYWVP